MSDENLKDLLRDAALRNSISEIEKCLQKGADINGISWSYTRLEKAMDDGNLNVINFLIKKGADINKSGYFKTSLFRAVHGNNIQMVKLLHLKGADLNVIDKEGNTAVAVSVKYQNSKKMEIAKYLVNAGVNLCKVGENGKTPLTWAVTNNDVEMLLWLLDHGAENTIPDAFWEALELKRTKIVQLLIKRGAVINFVYKNGYTPLTKAIELKNHEITKELIENGADVNMRDSYGNTGVALLIQSEMINLLTNLLENITDKNILNDKESHLLLQSISTGNVEIVKLLINAGASVNMIDSNGNYPLIKSIEIGNFQIVKALIETGANLNVNSESGCTPLILATQKENFEIVQYLIERGADVNQLYNEQSLLSIAASNKDIKVFQLLLDSGADLDLAIKVLEDVSGNDVNLLVYLHLLKERRKNLLHKTCDLLADCSDKDAVSTKSYEIEFLHNYQL